MSTTEELRAEMHKLVDEAHAIGYSRGYKDALTAAVSLRHKLVQQDDASAEEVDAAILALPIPEAQK